MKARKKLAVAETAATPSSQSGESNAGDKSTDWYRFEPARYNAGLAAIIRAAKTDAEIVEWAMTLGRALAEKRHGLNDLADWMLSERAAFAGQAAIYAKRRWQGQERVAEAPTATHSQPKAPPAIRNERTKRNRQKIKTENRNPKKGAASGSDSDSGNGSFLESEQPEAGKESAFIHPEPWKLAAEYCGQGRDKYTLNTFSKRYGEVGDREFRQELHAFMSEIEAGEKVNHMGRAFTSRLTRLRAQVKARAEIKESLRLAKAEGA